MEPVLLRHRHGAVEVVTLNRPERRNALSTELLAALDAAFDELASDGAVRAIVLTGAGDRAFCAGLDLKDFASDRTGSPVPGPDADPRKHTVIAWDYPKPIVAAVNGAAIAGGFELMMCCDLVVAAEHAVFGLAEVKRGLLPGGGGTLLATVMPLALALELALTGDPFDARRALDVGLVNRVVSGPRVLDEALALAARIAANGPLAVAMIKRLVRRGATVGGSAAWPSLEQIAQIFGSEDAKEGARAFVEKRAPRWVGR
jgi:enoyl-CoA hydratase/carnithine racemase